MDDINNLIALLNLILGLYFVIAGLLRKGSLYKNEYPAEIQAEARRAISVFSIIAGLLLTAISCLEIYQVENLQWLNYMLWGLCMVLVIVCVIYFKKKFGRYLK